MSCERVESIQDYGLRVINPHLNKIEDYVLELAEVNANE